MIWDGLKNKPSWVFQIKTFPKIFLALKIGLTCFQIGEGFCNRHPYRWPHILTYAPWWSFKLRQIKTFPKIFLALKIGLTCFQIGEGFCNRHPYRWPHILTYAPWWSLCDRVRPGWWTQHLSLLSVAIRWNWAPQVKASVFFSDQAGDISNFK